MKTKIVILGATGFIGKNLVHYFSKKNQYEVYAVYHLKKNYFLNNVKWIKANLLLEDGVARVLNNMDIVIQAAATTSGSKDIVNQPYLHVTDNAIMNSLILREILKHKIKHLVFFSCTVMLPSMQKKIREIDLNLNKKINSKYYGVAWTKIYIEKMCEFYSNISKTKFTIIRHSNIYGPHDKFDLEKSHVFGATITKVMSSNKIITIWGDGKESRDLLYVDDLVNFVFKAIKYQKLNFRIYNCGSGKGVKIKDLVKKIIKISKKNLTIKYDISKPTIVSNVFLNCNLAKKEINWQPLIPLELGIKKTINWWKKNIK